MLRAIFAPSGLHGFYGCNGVNLFQDETGRRIFRPFGAGFIVPDLGAGQKVKGKVGKTGSSFTYRKEKIRRAQLAAGSLQVIFKPASVSQKVALMDLREVMLVAVE